VCSRQARWGLDSCFEIIDAETECDRYHHPRAAEIVAAWRIAIGPRIAVSAFPRTWGRDTKFLAVPCRHPGQGREGKESNLLKAEKERVEVIWLYTL
jgi:hypothetical protein